MRAVLVALTCVLLAEVAWAQALPAEAESTEERASRADRDAYRDKRMVVYHTGPAKTWGARRGDGRMVGIEEFAEAMGDDDIRRLARAQRLEERKKLKWTFGAGAAVTAVGGGIALTQFNTDIAYPPEPDQNPFQAPEQWAAWDAERQAIEAEEDRRRRVNMRLRVGGLVTMVPGLALIGSGVHRQHRASNGRHLYMEHYEQDVAKKRVEAYNATLAHRFGIGPDEQARLDAFFPWRSSQMRPLE